MPSTKRPSGPDLTPRAQLTAPSSNSHIATKPEPVKFTVHGVDPVLVKWLRVYAAREEQTIGDLFNEAVAALKVSKGE